MSTIVDSRPRGTYVPVDCPQCRSQQEYMVPPTFIGTLRVRCAGCKNLFNHPQPKPSASASSSSKSAGASNGASSSSSGRVNGRRIGTDRNPIDMAYYDILGLESQCTTEEIKKAYRRLAIKLHPDKNRDDPDAEEKFKQIAVAYQILSDPELRHKYNEFGQKNGGGGGPDTFTDPEEVFGKMFGGDRFEDLIGVISIGKDMKEAFQSDPDVQEGDMVMGPNGKPQLTPEAAKRRDQRDKEKSDQKAKDRKERLEKLTTNLINRLNIYTEAARGVDDKIVGQSFKEKCRLEAEELKDENYGIELLQSIGRSYQSKAAHHMASSQFAPLGWFHGAKNSFNVVSDTVSTLRSALELKGVFDKLQAAEKAGLSPEEMRKLEEHAAEQGMRTLWKGAKLEVEGVVRDACDRALSDTTISSEKRQMRAYALNLIAEAFLAVAAEKPAEEFIKIETATSRQRDADQQPPHVPPRPEEKARAPPPMPPRPEASGNEKDETLHAAYKAYESKRKI